jgi:hypothetical protein
MITSVFIALAPFLLAFLDAAPLSVSQIVASPDQYVGQKIQVAGTIRIIPQYSRLPAPDLCSPATR